MDRVLRFGRKAAIYLFAALAVMLSLSTLAYLNFDFRYGFLQLKQHAIATGWYLPFYYSHVFAGGLILITGLIQFNDTIRSKAKGAHRVAGYIYVFGILLFAAPGGLVMSFFIDRGALVLGSFLVQCTLWFWFTIAAFKRIMQGDISGHRQWMMRSFSLTAAAVTLRVWIFFASWFVDLSQPFAYGTFALLSWIPNLLFAEVLIRRGRRSRSLQRVTSQAY